MSVLSCSLSLQIQRKWCFMRLPCVPATGTWPKLPQAFKVRQNTSVSTRLRLTPRESPCQAMNVLPDTYVTYGCSINDLAHPLQQLQPGRIVTPVARVECAIHRGCSRVYLHVSHLRNQQQLIRTCIRAACCEHPEQGAQLVSTTALLDDTPSSGPVKFTGC